MRYFILSLIFAGVGVIADASVFPVPIDSAWVRDHYDKREEMIPMRDGVKLFTCIYEPKDHSVGHPTLMMRTCYGSGPYGADEWMALERPTWALYAHDEYIIVFQDVRGKNMSEGEFEDIRPFIADKRKATDTDESSDTYDTVDWLVKHTSSNNCVGVFGISYPGFYSTAAALCGHPAVKAVSPQAPVTDWFRGDDTHHNGALFPLDMFYFSYWFQHVNTVAFWNGTLDMNAIVNPTDIVHSDVYNDYLKMGAVRNFTALLGDSCKFWSDMTAHPDLDEWWESRNIAYHCQDVKPAVMVVGGLFDAEDCYGAFTTYHAIRNQSPQTELYLVEGPWSHGEWSRGAGGALGDIFFGRDANMYYYLENIEYPFFSYYLDGKGQKPKPGALVWQTGENCWKHYPEGWKSDVEHTAYYLQPDGGISATMQIGPPTTYMSDPSHPVPFMGEPLTNRPATYMTADQRFASARPDVATFSTPVLTEPLVLDGSVEAELEVTLTTTDADFVVKLIDVFPDDFVYPDNVRRFYQWGRYRPLMSGYQMLVRGEVMRGKYRNCMALDSAAYHCTSAKAMKTHRFSPKQPEPFVPGEPTTVRIKMSDVAHTFMPGHRMMVQVQSSWFPLVDRNPQTFCNIYECGDDTFRPCTVSLLHSTGHASRILLPVIGHQN